MLCQETVRGDTYLPGATWPGYWAPKGCPLRHCSPHSPWTGKRPQLSSLWEVPSVVPKRRCSVPWPNSAGDLVSDLESAELLKQWKLLLWWRDERRNCFFVHMSMQRISTFSSTRLGWSTDISNDFDKGIGLPRGVRSIRCWYPTGCCWRLWIYLIW